MQRRLDRGQAQVQQQRDFVDRVIEYVLEDDAAALQRDEFEETRHGRAHRLLVRERILRVGCIAVRRVEVLVEWLDHTPLITAQVVERAVVGNTKQPRAHGGQFLQFREFVVGLGKAVLDHVLALRHRTGHARAVAVQQRPYVLYQRQELAAPFLEGGEKRVLAGCLVHVFIPVRSPNIQTRPKR